MRRYAKVLLFFFAVVLPILAHAQQPGSTAYNNVYLPAHGVGDTTRSRPVSWGGSAIDLSSSKHGWTLNHPTKEAAEQEAIAMCRSKGGLDCVTEFTFKNTCAVVTSSKTNGHISTNKSLKRARRDALKYCGRDCHVVWEGCSFPGG